MSSYLQRYGKIFELVDVGDRGCFGCAFEHNVEGCPVSETAFLS